MRVKMLVDAPGSPDGVTVNEYGKGEVYEVTDGLGLVFLAQGVAAVADGDPDPDAEPEQEPQGADTESKKAGGPGENK